MCLLLLLDIALIASAIGLILATVTNIIILIIIYLNNYLLCCALPTGSNFLIKLFHQAYSIYASLLLCGLIIKY